MTCRNTASGCNYPEGECLGLCIPKPFKVGTELVDRQTDEAFLVVKSNARETHYHGASGHGVAETAEVPEIFTVDREPCSTVAEVMAAMEAN